MRSSLAISSIIRDRFLINSEYNFWISFLELIQAKGKIFLGLGELPTPRTTPRKGGGQSTPGMAAHCKEFAPYKNLRPSPLGPTWDFFLAPSLANTNFVNHNRKCDKGLISKVSNVALFAKSILPLRFLIMLYTSRNRYNLALD